MDIEISANFELMNTFMADTKNGHKGKLLKIIAIQNKLVNDSKHFDNKTKEAFVNLGNYWNDRIEKESFTFTQLKSIANNILTYWQESIGIETELFWIELQKNNIEFERNDELNFALNKSRFRRVDIGIGARKDWSIIKDFDSIKARFTSAEIEKIDFIIQQDEKKRVEILNKCLKANKIPQSQYLKFGECWAYITNCELWEKYFNKDEVEKLYTVWTNFGTQPGRG
ncbi:hypothetical protein [Cytophaga aurantiaca]|uniref:hypothetical protein n=1 Tax=Cytophaga aurantiaca TaxID=29530 RepID=UPI000524CF8F|nr:hypothetical protein [Cytophaga aurantiaca]